MKYLINFTTAFTLLAAMNVGASIKTIDTDYYGKTVYIDIDTKEVISVGTGWRGSNGVDGTKEQATPYALGIGNAVSVITSVGRQFILQADGNVWMVDRRIDYNDIKVRPLVKLPIAKVSDVEANADHVFFIVDGSVYQMDLANKGSVELVKGLPNNIVEISVAIFHSIARTANGDVYIWGKNRKSQTTDGVIIDRATPRIIAGLPAIKAISTARYNTVLTDIDGNVWTMNEGRSDDTNGADFAKWSPVKLPISNPQTVVKGYAGMKQTMVLFNDAHVEMIGWHNDKNGGDFNMAYTMSASPELTGIQDLDSGGHSMFIKQGGRVIGWGANNHGQLGNGLFSETQMSGGMLPIIWPENYGIKLKILQLSLK
ncbi:MAG: hypothetical protein L3J75_01835 [Methylococcaceae bacterium]|nr:hypothetical protein [Methylococcaceae bacterium]